MQHGLAHLAGQETIDYALQRADHYERKHPMVAMVYRIVADILTTERHNAAVAAAAAAKAEEAA